MSDFRKLQSRHEELINKAQANQDVLDQVQILIADIKKSSSQISSSSERDQLRSNLRYWASYVYEKSGAYPNTDLSPSTVSPRPNWMLPSVIGVVAIIILLLWSILNRSAAQNQPQPSPSQIAITSSEFVPKRTPVTTGTSSPSATPTKIPLTATRVEAIQAGAIAIEIVSPRDGDEIQPVTTLRGTYSNLPFGYSIHVVVQPLSKSGLLFPMKQFATVSPTAFSGTWKIEGKFSQGMDLKEKEEYRIQMVAAMNDGARQALLAAVDRGMDVLPSGVIPFPQTINVNRVASVDFINGVRLIYSSFLDDEGNYEIFTTQTDGSDIRRVTYTSGFNEYFPSLSPDGTRIVYVGRRMNEKNLLVQSIDVINSDGTSVSTIVQNQINVIYERPLWSSDGRYIAYAVGTPQKDSPVFWNIYMYDLQENKSFAVTSGETTTNRFFSWIPNTFEIVFDSRISETGTSGFKKVDIQNPSDISIYFDGNNEELHPAVSPDGKLLTYVQLDNNAGNIYVVDLTTKEVTQLTTGDFYDSSPTWSPDGNTIYFDSAETAFITIWSVNIDGSNLTQLTFGKDRYPCVGVMYALIPK